MTARTSAATQSHDRERVRLHITPLTPDLYDRVVPPSLQPLARNISFHAIQTFPERAYGFVDLPAMEARKLRTKLHGSTWKGTKMSVEEARPVRKGKSDGEAEEQGAERTKAERAKKDRRTREDGVLVGHELEGARRVKRGWSGAESGEKKGKGAKRERNEHSADGVGERSLRFRTIVPPNKTALPRAQDQKKKKDKKGKQDKEKGRVVVEEFRKRKKSRNDMSAPQGAVPGSMSYVDGEGWVDEAGTLVEPARKSKRRKKQPSLELEAAPVDTAGDAVGGAQGGRSNPSSDGNEKEGDGSASADNNVDKKDSAAPSAADTPTSHPKEIHPLEALFKRPAPIATDASGKSAKSDARPSSSKSSTPNKPRPAPIDTSFSFFGSGGNNEDDEDTQMADAGLDRADLPPVTPHTKQDLEWRSLRSAAPTPDTAAIGRKFSFPFADDDVDEEDDDEDDDDDDVVAGKVEGHGEEGAVGQVERGEESAFRKWFFEHRGDLNRGWKKRRREERKAVRQRENRRAGRKVA